LADNPSPNGLEPNYGRPETLWSVSEKPGKQVQLEKPAALELASSLYFANRYLGFWFGRLLYRGFLRW
jgi:hypothetical protein